MILDLDTKKRKITNGRGQEVSLDNAKAFWETGDVEDCSLSFQRLANLDFDFDELDKAYAEMDEQNNV